MELFSVEITFQFPRDKGYLALQSSNNDCDGLFTGWHPRYLRQPGRSLWVQELLVCPLYGYSQTLLLLGKVILSKYTVTLLNHMFSKAWDHLLSRSLNHTTLYNCLFMQLRNIDNSSTACFYGQSLNMLICHIFWNSFLHHCGFPQ